MKGLATWTAACRICEDREWRNTTARKTALLAAERRAQRREADMLFGAGNVEPGMAGPGHEHSLGPRCSITDIATRTAA